jgi:hypothetical protein
MPKGRLSVLEHIGLTARKRRMIFGGRGHFRQRSKADHGDVLWLVLIETSALTAVGQN